MNCLDPLATDDFQEYPEINQQLYPAPTTELKPSIAIPTMIPTLLDDIGNTFQNTPSATSHLEQEEQGVPDLSGNTCQVPETTNVSNAPDDGFDWEGFLQEVELGTSASGAHFDRQGFRQDARKQLTTVDVSHIIPSLQTQNGTPNQQQFGLAEGQQHSVTNFNPLDPINSVVASCPGFSSHQQVSPATVSHPPPNVTSGLQTRPSYVSSSHCTSVSSVVGQRLTLGVTPNMSPGHQVSGVSNQQLLSGEPAIYQHPGINSGAFASHIVPTPRVSSTATFKQPPIPNAVISQQVQRFSGCQPVLNTVASHQIPVRNLPSGVYPGRHAGGTAANQQTTRPISSHQFVSRTSNHHISGIATSQVASGTPAARQFASRTVVHQQVPAQNTVHQPYAGYQVSTSNASNGASYVAGSSQPISILAHEPPLPILPTVLDDNTPTEERRRRKVGGWTFMFFWALLEVLSNSDGPSLVVWKDKPRLVFQVTRCSTKKVSELWSRMEGSPHSKGGTWNNLTARVKYSLSKEEGFFTVINPGKVPFPRSFAFGESVQERINRGCVNESTYQKLKYDLRDALRIR